MTDASPRKPDHVYLVDGSGYIFRAFHALPPLSRSDGTPTNAVLGFCNMVWKLMQDARNTEVGVTPTHFAVIFDYSSTTFRKEIYPEYKAHRPPAPEDLVPQFPLIRDATRAFNVDVVELAGYEADDVLGTLAAREIEDPVVVVSGDRDLLQVVTDEPLATAEVIANSRAADFPISSVNRGARVEPRVEGEGKVRLPRAGRNAF